MVCTARKAACTRSVATRATSASEASSQAHGHRNDSNRWLWALGFGLWAGAPRLWERPRALVVADWPTSAFRNRSLLLRLQAAFLRRLGRPCPGSLLRLMESLFQHRQQPAARG